jgi:ribosome-associated protein
MTDHKKTRSFAIEAARLLDERHCEDVRLLDVHGLSQVCDFVLIGTGTSERQMKSVAQELEDLGEENENTVYRSDRDSGGTWIVIDFVDIVAHLFEPSQRGYYDLETLWSDAEVVDWRKGRKVKSAKS